eukprot:gene28378-31512_t
MGGKAKPTKHTAKEINAKIAAATVNKGGGKEGRADRNGGAAGHAKFECPLCKVQAPSIKTMQAHHESKHANIPWEADKCVNKHEEHGGVTTAGVGVRGAFGKK